MAPDIYVYGKKIAEVPDDTGTYPTLNGGTIYVNTDQIDADAKKQIITLESDEIGGKRVLGLTQQGIGNSKDRKRGDKKDPEISVSLLNKPIRVSYNKTVSDRTYSNCNFDYGVGDKRASHEERMTLKNPRWIKRNGQG